MSTEATSEELVTKGRSVNIGLPGWLTVAIGAIMLMNLQTGCGFSSGPVRISVTGKVDLDDAPLLSGIIRFVPADNAGGPAAATKIIAGEFAFSSDNGPVVADHRVELKQPIFRILPSTTKRRLLQLPKPSASPRWPSILFRPSTILAQP